MICQAICEKMTFRPILSGLQAYFYGKHQYNLPIFRCLVTRFRHPDCQIAHTAAGEGMSDRSISGSGGIRRP
jgi:hypothetical protein